MSEIIPAHIEIGDHQLKPEYVRAVAQIGRQLVKIPSIYALDRFKKWHEFSEEEDQPFYSDLGEHFINTQSVSELGLVADNLDENADNMHFSPTERNAFAFAATQLNMIDDLIRQSYPDREEVSIASIRIVPGLEDTEQEALYQALNSGDVDRYIDVMTEQSDYEGIFTEEDLPIIAERDIEDFRAGNRILEVSLFDVFRQLNIERRLGGYSLTLVQANKKY